MNDSESDPSLLSPRIEGLAGLETTPRRIEERRLAAAIREVIDLLVTTTASTAELARAADDMEALAAVLVAYPRGQTYRGFAESANAGSEIAWHERSDQEWAAVFDHSPFIGLANPLSPPMSLHMHSDEVTGTVTFGSAYEGPPGNVHGGYVAAVFDELLGSTQGLSGAQGMTAYLHTDYRSPTPLHTELTMRAWVHDRVDRKIRVRGTIHAGERLTAECEGLFISMQPGVFKQLLNDRAELDDA